MTFSRSEKPADVGASNRLRKHALGNPRRPLATIRSQFIQRPAAETLLFRSAMSPRMSSLVSRRRGDERSNHHRVDIGTRGAISRLSIASPAPPSSWASTICRSCAMVRRVDPLSTRRFSARSSPNPTPPKLSLRAWELDRARAQSAPSASAGAAAASRVCSAHSLSRSHSSRRQAGSGRSEFRPARTARKTPHARKRSADGRSKAALFARVKDDGRAESALIAVAGLIREGRANG